MKIRIEGDNHCVEIECQDVNINMLTVRDIAEETWKRTKTEQPRTGIGYGSQLSHASHDRPVAGAGTYQRQPDPVTG